MEYRGYRQISSRLFFQLYNIVIMGGRVKRGKKERKRENINENRYQSIAEGLAVCFTMSDK